MFPAFLLRDVYLTTYCRAWKYCIAICTRAQLLHTCVSTFFAFAVSARRQAQRENIDLVLTLLAYVLASLDDV